MVNDPVAGCHGVTYENMNDKMAEAVPEVAEEYAAELRWWGDDKPGPHVIYGNIFAHYLLRLLKSDGENERLRRAFEFLEVLASHEDPLVRDVVNATVVSDLFIDRRTVEAARRFMGPKTLESADANEPWHRLDE